MRRRCLIGVVWLVALTIAPAAPATTRRWSTAYEVSGVQTFPRRFADGPRDQIVLWASGERSAKYTFLAGERRPQISRRAAVRNDFDEAGAVAVNRSGALLRTARLGGRALVIFEDERGARQNLRPYTGDFGEPAFAVGEDGTAAVAWATRRSGQSRLKVRLREPDGRFRRATVAVRTAAEIGEAAVAVAPDGAVEITYVQIPGPPSSGYEIRHVERLAGGRFSRPRTVVTGLLYEPSILRSVGGGPGRSRLVYNVTRSDPTVGTIGGIDAVLRTSDGGWTSPETLARPDRVDRRIAPLPNGGAVFIAVNEGALEVRTAKIDRPFGAPQRLAPSRPLWQIIGPRIAVARHGGLIAGWTEAQQEFLGLNFGPESCFPCHTRVVATVAPAGHAFEKPPIQVSPLGTYVDPNFTQVGLSRSGRPAAAWLTVDPTAGGPEKMVVAFGSDRPLERGARQPGRSTLSVSATATRAGARAAARTGRLRVGVRCSEACDLRIALIDTEPEAGHELGAARMVLAAGGHTSLRLPIYRGVRRNLLAALRHGDLRVRISAVDRAGNVLKRWRRLR